MFISTCAKTLGICVNRKVGGLQSAYLAGSSSARASLARLRKTDQQGGAPWIVVGEELFEDLPDLGYGPAVEHKELLSIRASLRYYAMLQQSKKYPVALIGSKGNEGTFGSACGRIASGDDKGAPVGTVSFRRFRVSGKGIQSQLHAVFRFGLPEDH